MSDDDTSKKDGQETISMSGEKNSTDSAHATSSKSVLDKKAKGKKASTTSKSKIYDKSSEKSRTGSKFSTLVSGILFVAIAISMAGIFMLWQQQQKNQYKQQAQSQLISSLESELKKYTAGQNKLRSEITKKVTSEIKEIESSIADIKELGSKSYRDWVLSESEYLLRIANHRLQLEGDINTAIKALKIADSKIKSLKEPSLLPVRKQLADEISALESTRLPDIHGMVLALDSLQTMSPKMKLKISILPKEAEETSPISDSGKLSIKDWELVLDKIWDELKTLIVIKQHDQALAPVLTVAQQQTIRHILQLKIQGIRIALLNKQQDIFLGSIENTRIWLNKYFSQDGPNVALLESRLQEFKTKKLNVALPDIGRSLRALQSVQKQPKGKAKPAIKKKPPAKSTEISESKAK